MTKRKKKKEKDDKPETLAERIRKVCKDLYYISETDAEIVPFVGKKAEMTDAPTLLQQLKSDAPVEERDFEELFKRLTEHQEWFGEEEIRTANNFKDLQDLLEKNLRDIKVFKVGKIELDVFIVGLDAENVLTGIRTKAVET